MEVEGWFPPGHEKLGSSFQWAGGLVVRVKQWTAAFTRSVMSFIEVYRRAARAGEEGAGSSAVAEESRFLSVTVGRASYTSAISISWDRAWPKQ